jgi:hypothetical protein
MFFPVSTHHATGWIRVSLLDPFPTKPKSAGIYRWFLLVDIHGFATFPADLNPPSIPPSGRKNTVRKRGKMYLIGSGRLSSTTMENFLYTYSLQLVIFKGWDRV